MTTTDRGVQRYVTAVTVLAALAPLTAGVWAYVAPPSFAEAVNFAPHEHFLHDVGAFQIGLGALLLIGLIWADALATVLAGFLLANTLHTVAHVLDLDLGGDAWQAWALGALSVALAVALWLRLRQMGYVVGAVHPATPRLAPFARQKTVRLTTYRKDGAAGSTPVSIAVDGERAYVRSFEKSIKTRRLHRDPNVQLAACTGKGTPTGAPIAGRMRRLDGAEYRHAAHLLRRKHPMLHGVLIPLAHRLGRSKTGRTVHFELVPVDAREEASIKR